MFALWFYLLWGPFLAGAVALYCIIRQASLAGGAVPVLAVLGTLTTGVVAGPVVAGVQFFPAAPWWAAAVGVGKGPDTVFWVSVGIYFVLLLDAGWPVAIAALSVLAGPAAGHAGGLG